MGDGQIGGVAEIGLRVGVLHAEADAETAARIATLLEEGGVEIVAADSAPAPDGLVVLISDAAFGADGWPPLDWVRERNRLIPVRVGAVDEQRVPERLRELNWIDWSLERPAQALGFVVAGLLSDPSRYRISRQLAHEAASWVEAGRPASHLIGDRRRARRMKELLQTLDSDPLASLDEATIEFVAVSDRATRKSRRRRLLWRGLAAVAVMAAIGGVPTGIAALEASSRTNRASIVTAGDDAVLDQLPEWSAINGAALMLEGSPAQRRLGRSALLQAMVRPWETSDTTFIDSARSAATFRDGTRAAVIALVPGGSGFALFDVRRGLTLATVSLDRRYDWIDIDPDERTAVVAGYGAAEVVLRTGRNRSLTRRGPFVGVAALRGQVALWTAGGRLELLDRPSGHQREVSYHSAVLDVVPAPRGRGGMVLVSEGRGRFAIRRLPGGEVVAGTRLAGPVEEVGTLHPDGRRAVVAGGGQLWTFDAASARPTGIATPIVLNDIEWVGGERLVLASDSERGEVIYLPRAQRLGEVCASAPSLLSVWVEPGGETVSCGGDGRSFWRLPPAPLEAGVPRRADPPSAVRSPYATVQIRGRRERILGRGELGSGVTGWSQPFDSAIAAAVFSPRSHQLALGSKRGTVALLGLTRRGAESLTFWMAPDRAPIVDLRWRGQLLAETASGQLWRVPDCPHCETNRGLLATARARLSGCFSERQLTWISTEVRRRLNLRECEPNFVIGAD